MSFFRLFAITALQILPLVAIAQSVQLTDEQRQLLEQLPPAQQQQALDALEQLNSQGQTSTQQSPNAREGAESPRFESQVAEDDNEAPDQPIAAGRSGLVITVSPSAELRDDELAAIDQDPALRRIVGSNYYELDDSGNLVLPGLERIALFGLTAGAIEERLGAVAALADFEIAVTLLVVEEGSDALEPFGYELFALSTVGFDPVATGPVPPDYVIGPGDEIRIQLFGNVNGIYELEVTRQGFINLPNLGPVNVAGLSFSEFRKELDRQVQEKLIGTRISATMGQLRTIRVFVLGDASRPGSYIVSSLATMSSALYYSGGISDIGSLRRIQLKRRGEVVSELDLYDLLLNGDTSGDARLQPGDVIFIPPIGPTVGVGGAVRRPAVYELRGANNVRDIIDLAGGLRADAYAGAARLERIDPDDGRMVVSIDLSDSDDSAMRLTDGDVLFVPDVLPVLNDSVTVLGHVQRPGASELWPGMRLADLLPDASYLKPIADADYVLIRREDAASRKISVVSASLREAWANPASAENVRLDPRDTVYVFSLEFGRQRTIEPLLRELQLQSRAGNPFREVSVSGYVNAPGVYPLEEGMRVSDLVRAGGSLSEEAFTLHAELARYEIVDDRAREASVIKVDLEAILRGDESADIALAEHDNLRISSIPRWDSLWSVDVDGEVKFPGTYRIRRGETLRELLERAGGLTDEAFPAGAVFLRENLREREQEQIDTLIRRIESDITTTSLETLDTTGTETLETGRVLLEQLRQTEAVGRLVIDLEQQALTAGMEMSVTDVELRDGDRLLVPKQAQEVTVIGETQQNTSHLFQPGLNRDDYIQMSGGLTRRADKKLIYVVRASGAVVAGNSSRWFGRDSGIEIRPGDTIVVPIDTTRVRPLTLWANVTQILYQAAIAVAAVNSFD